MPTILGDALNFPSVLFSYDLFLLAELPDPMDFFREVRPEQVISLSIFDTFLTLSRSVCGTM